MTPEQIAFGPHPGREPPRAGDPHQRWLAAVALGGQGHYAAAAALAEELITGADRVLGALAASTLASHRRQLGGHADARRLDARALGLLGDRHSPPARSDALLGLAADAVGLGRHGEARRLIAAARALGDTGWRGDIRLGWVLAETELVAGRAADAVPHARRAVELATDCESVRHRVKSQLVLGAALATAGDTGHALPMVAQAAAHSAELGLLPLVWPSELLLTDLDPANATGHRSRAARALHAVLLRTDPVGARLARVSAWVPTWLFSAAPNE